MDKSCKRQKRFDGSGSIKKLESEQKSGHDVLTVTIKELSVLYSSYMPFLINGGIFIPTIERYDIGDEVFLLINLLNEKNRIPAVAEVAWITPLQAQANRAAGIGLRFLEKNSEAKNKIENYLSSLQNLNQRTCTL